MKTNKTLSTALGKLMMVIMMSLVCVCASARHRHLSGHWHICRAPRAVVVVKTGTCQCRTDVCHCRKCHKRHVCRCHKWIHKKTTTRR